MIRRGAAAIALGVLLAPAPRAAALHRDDPPAAATSAPAIELAEKRLRTHVAALASDEFAGRQAGTEGGRLAASYLENEFRSIGLAPGVKKSFRQAFRRTGRDLDPDTVALLRDLLAA